LYNGRGDVVQLTNSAGNVTATYDYDAFGNLLSVNDHPNPFRYCGEYWDYETKTYYLRARYYNPATGRFLAEDPIRAGLNWYVYCGNNPIMFVDPWGLAKQILNITSYILNDELGNLESFVKLLTKRHTYLVDSPRHRDDSGDLLELGEAIDIWNVKDAIRKDTPILPYDEFLTERGAVYAWARVYHPLSMPTDEYPNGSEWGAWIYRSPTTGRYCFGAEPLPDERDETWVKLSPQNPAYETIGWIHSHPNPGSGHLSEHFSGAPGDRRVTVSIGVPGYLVTPSGVVLRLDPSWPEKDVIAIPNTDPYVSTYFENIFRK